VQGDEEVDALCASLFRETFGSALSQEHRVDGEHATNIAG
jgi:hypothetical protein